jgi:hypothetical protein
MMKSQARQALWIGLGSKLALAAPLCALWACGAPARDEPAAGEDEPAPSSSGGSQPSGEPAPPPSGGAGSPGGAEPAFGLSGADFVEALAGQVGRVCGAALDRCTATGGCEQILACAAVHGCTGATCYCADARCEVPGPCRSVIDGAPGAVSGAAAGSSRGPAADAAAAVGVCIEQLLSAPGGAPGAG